MINRLILIWIITLTVNITAFAQLSNKISNSNYSNLVKDFRHNKIDLPTAKALALVAKSKGERKLADSIGEFYINQYIAKLSSQDIIQKENLDFLIALYKGNNSKINTIVKQNTTRIDSVIERPGYGTLVMDYWITKSLVNQKLWIDNNPEKPVTLHPNWLKIEKPITSLYGKNISKRIITNAKITWFTTQKDTINVIHYTMEKLRTYGLDTSWGGKLAINNFFYEYIFLKETDKKLLLEASKWMKEVIDLDTANGSYIDTYANLLYKAGQYKKAVDMQRKAVDLEPNAIEIRKNYEKMKEGIPTWKMIK